MDNNACDDKAELGRNPENFHPCGLDRGLFIWITMLVMDDQADMSISWARRSLETHENVL